MFTSVFVSVVLALASAAPQGVLRDTAEVAAARANFISEFNRLARLAAEAPDNDLDGEGWRSQQLQDEVAQVSPKNIQSLTSVFFVANPSAVEESGRWPGPFAATEPAGLNPKQVPDTAEVAAARAAHLRAHSAAKGARVVQVTPVAVAPKPVPVKIVQAPRVVLVEVPLDGINKWTGPFAATEPAGLNPKQVPETAEVAAARAAHLRAHNAARGVHEVVFEETPRWPGPFAATEPAGLNPVQVPDTAEVAAARAAHFRVHSAARGARFTQ